MYVRAYCYYGGDDANNYHPRGSWPL